MVLLDGQGVILGMPSITKIKAQLKLYNSQKVTCTSVLLKSHT